jgi:putative hydrolase of HD superfamily
MSKEKNVLDYYILCNKLKNVVRTGWLNWNVKRERVESIAEHVYGTQQLAIAMHNIYDYKIDLSKVILMLSVHELEETIIGDLTQHDISKEEKKKIGEKAVEDIFKKYELKQSIKELILEFDDRKTEEAKFAYMCDKLECDIQSKLYDEENCVDLNNQNNIALDNSRVKKLLEEGKSWSEMWMEFGREHCPFDKNFESVSIFAENNNLHEIN